MDRRFGHKNRKCSLKCGDNKNQNGMKNNVVMKCIDCGFTKHLVFRKEVPNQIGRMKKKSSILDGVREQINKGYKPSEILACLAFTSDESLQMEDEENCAESTEVVEVGFSVNRRI